MEPNPPEYASGSPSSPFPCREGGQGGDFRLALAILTLLYLLGFKLIFGAAAFPVLLIGWLLEGCLLGWIYLLGAGLARFRALRRLHLDAAAFHLLWWPCFLSFFAHDFFFREAAERRISPLDLSPASLSYFLREVLPGWGLWLLLLSVAALLAGAFLLRRLSWRAPAAPLAGALAGLSLVAFCAARLVPAFPSPLTDLVDDLQELATHPSVRPPADRPPPLPMDPLDRSRRDRPALVTRFKKVLVLLMESTTQRTLLDNIEWLPQDIYFKTLQRTWHGYPGYRACNQDSRTGELSLLFSRLVPFEAYSEESARNYLGLAREHSLVDLFNDNGYRTAYATAEVDGDRMIGELPWQEKILLSPERFEHPEGQLCFNPFEFERSCEDRILLPSLFDFLDRNDRAFLFYVFIWGHAYDYYRASRIPNVQYYGEFLRSLVEHLRARGQLEDTLIVVTSDHGVRDREFWTDPSAYRIPLLFINPRFENRERPGLLSHVDFADLLVDELEERPAPPAGHPFILFTGPTSSSVVGAITAGDELWVIKDRSGSSILLGHTPPVRGSSLTGGEAWPFLDLYHRYQEQFLAAP